MKKVLVLFLTAMLSLAMVACSGEKQTDNKLEEQTIKLAAAASLQKAFEEELIPMFNKSHPEITVQGTYASSGKLQTQIEEGFDADVFFSAATKQMKALTEKEMIATDTRVDLLQNELALVVSVNSTLGLETFEDITKASTIALGDPDSVPAGQYAKEALTTLNLWDEVNSKQVSFDTQVTDVLAHVAEGAAEAGIVYASDAATNKNVKVVAKAPAGSIATPVVYPVAMLANTQHEEAAKLFLEFLQTEEAKAVFVSYGFSINQ